jgi:serine/threonine protein kinase/HEAT repeat protein
MRVCTSCRRLLRGDAARCPDDGAETETVATLPKDTRIGVYKINRVLGEGGMGFVYEATHEALNRRTAIKMLRPELSKIDQIVTRFLNEAKAVNLIDHQNIVNIYDYGDGADGSVYFVMEYLEGETLDDLMRKRMPMQVPLLLHVFGQMGKALAAAHAKRIVHRDLKPGNVFVVAREDNPCFIKLLDFGIAQLRGEGAVQGLTMAGTVMGTPQYMSPEQISGGEIDARTDVWALGVMLYRAATGHAPFQGEEFAELADKIFNHAPVPAHELVPMPAALAKLIASCLERRIEDRCQSVADFLTGLERVKQECKLDDDAILEAVRADSGGVGEGVPRREPTHKSIGSVEWHKDLVKANARLGVVAGAGAAGAAAGPGAAAPARRSRLGLYMAIGALAGGIGSAGFVLLGRGKSSDAKVVDPIKPEKTLVETTPTSDKTAPPGPKGPLTPEQHLREVLRSGTLQEQGFAIEAIGRARVPAGAPLLYLALKGPADVRMKAAQALAELALPESAPKVRDALAEAGDKLRVELAAVLYRLGDKDAQAILRRATEDPALQIGAAAALAEAGNGAGRAVLASALDDVPVGHPQWRRAAGGLLKLGDAKARKLLEGELAQPDATRAVGAAELLARAGDAKAREQLARNVGDQEFARRGEAAVALARMGDTRALGWVATGLASVDADERKHALAVCGALAADAKAHAGAIRKLAADDPDLNVRLTAEAVLLGL